MRKISFIAPMLAIFLVSYQEGALAQSKEELYRKVFGQGHNNEKEISIDASLGDYFIGTVTVKIMGDKILALSGADLKKVLVDKIREEKFKKYQLSDEFIKAELLPFPVFYHPEDVRVSLEIAPSERRPVETNVYDDLMPYFSRKSIDPAPFSLGINYKLEQNFNKINNQQRSFLAQTDSFMNIKNVTFENQMNYLSNRTDHWGRLNSRAIYDRPQRMQRLEVGDVSYPLIGYQQGPSLGGVAFYRDFSLNPYRSISPTSKFEYQISSRSLVKTYVNNLLLKTEYMNAGQYSVRDIPLNNGINRIRVEVTDDLGATKVYIFNDSSSLDLLAEKVGRYALVAGYPSREENGQRLYDNDNGAFYSGFYQYGLTKHWTPSLYIQGKDDFNLWGSNQVLTTSFGNWSVDMARSKNRFNDGHAESITYQLNLFGAYWYDSHTLSTKVEYRSPYFNEAGENFRNRFDVIGTASYSVPLFEKFNLALGGSWQNPSIAEGARLAYNMSLTTKIFDSNSFTVFAGRDRDEFKKWSSQVYFFLNISFDESSSFASLFYERETQTKRLTAIRDTGKKINDLKIAVSADDSAFNKNASLDLQYNTVLADVGVREEMAKSNQTSAQYQTSVRLLSSFAYVHNGEDSAFSISRPISNSFVIFRPHKDWKGQKFGVQSTGYDETVNGLFGESLLSGLSPYQYKRLQLDPSYLDPGYTLGQESFVVYPRKNSGHLFVIGKTGQLVLKGKLLDSSGKPLVLKVGSWMSDKEKNIAFFTDRDGAFFIEGVSPGPGTLKIDDDHYAPINFDFSGKKQGMLDLSNITLQEGQ